MSANKMASEKTATASPATGTAKAEKDFPVKSPVEPGPTKQVKRGRNPVDPNETPAQRFRRLGGKRMNKALKAIGYVASLGNKRQYEYTDEQRNKIIAALVDAVDNVRQRLTDKQSAAESFSV